MSLVVQIYDKLLANGALPCAATLQVASQIASRRMLDAQLSAVEEEATVVAEAKQAPPMYRSVGHFVREELVKNRMNGEPWSSSDFFLQTKQVFPEVSRVAVKAALQYCRRTSLLQSSGGKHSTEWRKINTRDHQ